jgi:hypothetical protein
MVTFLEDEESLGAVDPEFRGLVEILHQIPYCASFGVSCAGHFYETNGPYPKSFRPTPWGHLNIIVPPNLAHIKELLTIFKAKIGSYPDASFKKINHVFGPAEGSGLEVWEMRIGDNGCLCRLVMGKNWYGEDLLFRIHRNIYKKSKARYGEIKQFWKVLENEVDSFCRQHNFTGGFMLEKRIEEITSMAKEERCISRS